MHLVWFVASLFVSHVYALASPTPYEGIKHHLKELEREFPDYAKTITIGENDEGAEIVGLRIAEHPEKMDPRKTGHLMISTHHGNEPKTADFTFDFAHELLKKMRSGKYQATEWTLIPVLNISGYNKNERLEYGIDPNRNYPGICISNPPERRLKSVSSLMKFLNSRIFTGSVTVHGYAHTMSFPWGVSTDITATNDFDIFERATKRAAAINGYPFGTSTDLVYAADNTYEDYAYWKYGMYSLLLELEDGSPADLDKSTSAMLAYYEGLENQPSRQHQFRGHCR